MKRRLTGIELRSNGLSALELKKARGGFVIANAATIDFTPEGTLAGALAELFEKHGFSRRAAFSVAPPDNRIFMNQIQTALPRLQQVRSVLKSQVEDSVPIHFEDIIADIGDGWGDGENIGARKTVTAVTISRSELQNILEAFDNVGLSPKRVAPAASSLNTLVHYSGKEMKGRDFVTLHFDRTRTFIAFYKNGCQALLRTMRPIDPEHNEESDADPLFREMELGLRRLYGSTDPDDFRVLISAKKNIHDSPLFARLPGNKEFISIDSKFKGTEELDDLYLIPAALAMRANKGGFPNFLKVLKEEDQAAKKPVALIAAAGILAFALLSVATGRFYMTYKRLEQVNARLDRDIEENFRAVMPEYADLYDPVGTLQSELEELKQRHEGLQAAVGTQNNPVAVLSAFYENIPEGLLVETERVRAEPESLHISGIANSFGEAEELREKLAELALFDRVDISNRERRGTNEVSFELNISY